MWEKLIFLMIGTVFPFLVAGVIIWLTSRKNPEPELPGTVVVKMRAKRPIYRGQLVSLNEDVEEL